MKKRHVIVKRKKKLNIKFFEIILKNKNFVDFLKINKKKRF
jgi:hypothetical protein